MKKRINNCKKGFGLTEVICSIAIFSIIVVIAFKTHIIISKNKYKDEMVKNYMCFASGVKYNLLKNCSYEEIDEFKKENKVYINSKNISIDKLINYHIKNLMEDNKPKDEPYLEVFIVEENGVPKGTVFNIEINLHYSIDNKNFNITNKFLKGNY